MENTVLNELCKRKSKCIVQTKGEGNERGNARGTVIEVTRSLITQAEMVPRGSGRAKMDQEFVKEMERKLG